MKQIRIWDIDWRILSQMKLDRNFKTFANLISNLVHEESLNKKEAENANR